MTAAPVPESKIAGPTDQEDALYLFMVEMAALRIKLKQKNK